MTGTRAEYKGHTIIVNEHTGLPKQRKNFWATIIDNKIRWTVYSSDFYKTAEEAMAYGKSYVGHRVKARG